MRGNSSAAMERSASARANMPASAARSTAAVSSAPSALRQRCRREHSQAHGRAKNQNRSRCASWDGVDLHCRYPFRPAPCLHRASAAAGAASAPSGLKTSPAHGQPVRITQLHTLEHFFAQKVSLILPAPCLSKAVRAPRSSPLGSLILMCFAELLGIAETRVYFARGIAQESIRRLTGECDERDLSRWAGDVRKCDG